MYFVYLLLFWYFNLVYYYSLLTWFLIIIINNLYINYSTLIFAEFITYTVEIIKLKDNILKIAILK